MKFPLPILINYWHIDNNARERAQLNPDMTPAYRRISVRPEDFAAFSEQCDFVYKRGNVEFTCEFFAFPR